MKTVFIFDATLRKLTRFVDLWKEAEELAGFTDDKKFTKLKGWVTLSELRDMPRSVILDALGYELGKGVRDDVVSYSVCVAASRCGIKLFPKGFTLTSVVAHLHE